MEYPISCCMSFLAAAAFPELTRAKCGDAVRIELNQGRCTAWQAFVTGVVWSCRGPDRSPPPPTIKTAHATSALTSAVKGTPISAQ